MTDKPFKGTITRWRKVHFGSEYAIFGTCMNHPQFGRSTTFHTSVVLRHNRLTGEIETLNSLYILEGPEVPVSP